MENGENQIERIARLEEKMIAADKALGLAQESLSKKDALESRVSVLEAVINQQEGKRKGSSEVLAWGITIITVAVSVAVYFKK